jgi:CRP-like cAMP-binding protein
VLSAAWLSVRQGDINKTTVSLDDVKAWYTPSLQSKARDNWNIAQSVLRQKQACLQSLRIQQDAHDASIDHQNRMLKKKHIANLRLQRRLAARGGSLPSSFQVEPLRQIQKSSKVLPILFNASLVAKFVDQHQAAEQVDAIRKNSEASRQKKAHSIHERQKSSTAQLQKRLALRQKAKQARALKKCTLFQNLSDQAHDQVVDVMNFEQMKKGTVLCTQGFVADQMYLLMLGQCSVQVDALHVANLYELDLFGEGALFSAQGEKVQSATVTAEEDVEVLVLSRAALKTLLHSQVLDEKTMMELYFPAVRKHHYMYTRN